VNPVGALLRVEDILLDVDVAGPAALLDRVAAALGARARVSPAQVLASLTVREELGSTALGHGVAIPHARMSQCNAVAGAFVRTRMAISFGAPDLKPVSLFLGLLVPKQATEHHLQLLATAANMFGDRGFRDALRTCPDAKSALELFVAWPAGPAVTPDSVARPQ
jgi:PTS system nitrogen regulatory IIA component